MKDGRTIGSDQLRGGTPLGLDLEARIAAIDEKRLRKDR